VNLPDGLLQPPFAHRGLWTLGEAAENSLAAIERACQAGYGVEFDVRLTRDGEAVVFHDETLERMAGLELAVADLTLGELDGVALQGGPDRIPTLHQVLSQVAGRQMMLIELKAGPDPMALADRIAVLLEHYSGPVAAISFDAAALGWFAQRRPDTPRGLDAMWDADYEAEARDELERQFALCQPHFLVLEKSAAMGELAAEHRLKGQPVIAWTMRSTDDVDQVADYVDNFIFEGFTA
jgi:glycerophosphoryl diester phosphodiesterase